MLDKLIADLQTATTGICDDALINRGAGWIVEFEKEFPMAHALIRGFMEKDAAYVLDGLILMQPALAIYRGNENALAYIGALQAKLKGRKKKP